MIISKLFALKNSSERRYKRSDIPDVALMFEHNADLDLNYLTDRMSELGLVLPKAVEADVAPVLSRVSRKIRNTNRGLSF